MVGRFTVPPLTKGVRGILKSTSLEVITQLVRRDDMMGRDQIRAALNTIFRERFQIVEPGVDENLRDAYEFDSIDAVELLHEIEILLGAKLTQAEKKSAMDIRTINQIIDYIESLSSARRFATPSDFEKSLSPVEQ
jgi:acyl carrier protein